MIKQKMLELLSDSDFDSEVREVVLRVIEEEYKRLDTIRPRGIKDEIRKIIEQEVALNETKVSETEELSAILR